MHAPEWFLLIVVGGVVLDAIVSILWHPMWASLLLARLRARCTRRGRDRHR